MSEAMKMNNDGMRTLEPSEISQVAGGQSAIDFLNKAGVTLFFGPIWGLVYAAGYDSKRR